ncbi:hypothetical protein JCM18899A_19120 [Nocardioides sp. AN3]
MSTAAAFDLTVRGAAASLGVNIAGLAIPTKMRDFVDACFAAEVMPSTVFAKAERMRGMTPEPKPLGSYLGEWSEFIEAQR